MVSPFPTKNTTIKHDIMFLYYLQLYFSFFTNFIKSIVNKYDGIMNTYMYNGYFVVDIMLCVTRTPSSLS